MARAPSRPPPEGVKIISESLFEFCGPKYPEKPIVEIIFFHSIQLGAEDAEQPQFSTWAKKSSPNEYWPMTLFNNDPLFQNHRVRALTAYYDGKKIRTGTAGRGDLYLIAENFVSTIIDSPRVNVGQKEGVPVILVGHSFGGFVIKKLVDKAAEALRASGDKRERIKRFLDNLAGVFYYSTPHIALSQEVVDHIFPQRAGTEYSLLKAFVEELSKDAARLQGDMNAQLRLQGKNWNGTGGVKSMEVFENYETDLGFWKGQIVAEGSGRNPIGQGGVLLDEDHFSICKADADTDSTYTQLANFIWDILEKGPVRTGSGN